MWVFLREGFFSAVQSRDPDFLVVRSRKRVHLEQLKREYGIRAKINPFIGDDYPFRILLHKESWAQVLVDATRAIDYTNFKASLPHADRSITERVWALLAIDEKKDGRRGRKRDMISTWGGKATPRR